MATTETLNSDILTRFLLPDFYCRGAILRGSNIIAEGARVHGLNGPVASLFGQTLLAAIMLLSISKGGMRQVLQLDGSDEGALKRLLAESRAGAVRGLINWQEDQQVLHHHGGSGLHGWMGKPLRLSTVRDMGFGQPYISTIQHDSDFLADHIIHYLSQSVQINADLIIHGDMALMIEAMPGCDDERWFNAVKAMARIPDTLLENGSVDAILAGFAPATIKIAGSDHYAYRCDCSQEKMRAAVEGMKGESLRDMADENSDVTISCQYCDQFYTIHIDD